VRGKFHREWDSLKKIKTGKGRAKWCLTNIMGIVEKVGNCKKYARLHKKMAKIGRIISEFMGVFFSVRM